VSLSASLERAALEERGFEDARRRVSGLAQFAGARRSPA
jgi:hypothetical protein